MSRINRSLLKKLKLEKENPSVDTNTYLYYEDRTKEGKVGVAIVAVDTSVYSLRKECINNIPWQISE